MVEELSSRVFSEWAAGKNDAAFSLKPIYSAFATSPVLFKPLSGKNNLLHHIEPYNPRECPDDPGFSFRYTLTPLTKQNAEKYNVLAQKLRVTAPDSEGRRVTLLSATFLYSKSWAGVFPQRLHARDICVAAPKAFGLDLDWKDPTTQKCFIENLFDVCANIEQGTKPDFTTVYRRLATLSRPMALNAA